MKGTKLSSYGIAIACDTGSTDARMVAIGYESGEIEVRNFANGDVLLRLAGTRSKHIVQLWDLAAKSEVTEGQVRGAASTNLSLEAVYAWERLCTECQNRSLLTYIAALCIVEPCCSSSRVRYVIEPSEAMEFSKDLIAASSTPIVLAILVEGDSYGYAILQRVRQSSGGLMEWTDGMLYPVLHRLERLGYIEARWESAESGRRRKYYRITSQGRARLAEEREQWQAVNSTLQGIWQALSIPDPAISVVSTMSLPQEG